MKMYIIIHQDTPDHLVPVIAAHASLACFRQFEEDSDMQQWINAVFRKVVCVVDDTGFQQLKSEEKQVVLTESSLENKEVCIAFCPRPTYPKRFKYLSLWRPQNKR